MIRSINYSTKNDIEESVASFTITDDNQVLDFHTISSVIKSTTVITINSDAANSHWFTYIVFQNLYKICKISCLQITGNPNRRKDHESQPSGRPKTLYQPITEHKEINAVVIFAHTVDIK